MLPKSCEDFAQRMRLDTPRSPTALRTSEVLPRPSESARVSRTADQAADGLPGASGPAASARSAGSLWGEIEPCWRNMDLHGRVPVSLEVTLSSDGRLSRPPKLLRSATAVLDEPRLKSEAAALAAIAACAPRGDLQLGGKTYRLDFPAE